MSNILWKLIIVEHKKATSLRLKEFNSWKMCKVCYIRKEEINHKDKNYRKLSDPCHFIGEYRETANYICNLRYAIPKKLSVISNNGYNYHLFI